MARKWASSRAATSRPRSVTPSRSRSSLPTSRSARRCSAMCAASCSTAESSSCRSSSTEPMHETPDDLTALQALLDGSFERAGEHFRRITTDERRVDVVQLCDRLQGMKLLVLATVTKYGHPLNGPV